jgi:hypothetical protein
VPRTLTVTAAAACETLTAGAAENERMNGAGLQAVVRGGQAPSYRGSADAPEVRGSPAASSAAAGDAAGLGRVEADSMSAKAETGKSAPQDVDRFDVLLFEGYSCLVGRPTEIDDGASAERIASAEARVRPGRLKVAILRRSRRSLRRGPRLDCSRMPRAA